MPRTLTLLLLAGFALRLAAIAYLNPDGSRALLSLQAALSAVSGYFLYQLGRRRFSQALALALTAAWMLYPAAILLSARPHPATLLLFLWLAALVVYDQLEARQFRWDWAALLGALLGGAILVAPVAAVLAAAIFTYLGLIRYETPAALRWRAVAVSFTVCLLLVLPARLAQLPLLFPTRGEQALSATKVTVSSDAFARLWQTDARLWLEAQPAAAVSGAIPPAPSASRWALVIMALPYMLIVGFGVAGFYLVRHFPERGLFLLQLFYGILWLRAPAALGNCGHVPYIPALLVGAAALVRPRVWTSVPPWRRLFLLWTLGMLVGIWLQEAMTLAGW